MKFNEINRIILFGGARVLAELTSNISKKFEIYVFSSKRHLEESIGESSLEEYLIMKGIKYFSSENINQEGKLTNLVNENTLGIALGASWVFDKKTVDLFNKNHLLDFMGIGLPRYRGGAHYTWQILNQNRTGCSNLQIIEGGKETFHKGKIIKRNEYELPSDLKMPIDFFEYIVKKEIEFMGDFFNNLKNEFYPKNLDESENSYYPFLYTLKNGLIDWRWKGTDICLFINAFDEPYLGASTFLNGSKVFLKDCMLLDQTDEYHPFTSGIVIRKDEKSIYIASIGNLLKIGKVTGINGVGIDIKPGDRLYTSQNELDESMKFSAEYDSNGVKE